MAHDCSVEDAGAEAELGQEACGLGKAPWLSVQCEVRHKLKYSTEDLRKGISTGLKMLHITRTTFNLTINL